MSFKALTRVFVSTFVVGVMWVSTPALATKNGAECTSLKSKAACSKNAVCNWNKKCVAKDATAAKKPTASKAKPVAKKVLPKKDAPAAQQPADPMMDNDAEGGEDF